MAPKLPTNKSNLPQRSLPRLRRSQKTNKQITQNFNLMELEKYEVIPARYRKNCIELLKNLQIIRDVINKSITIHSGYRGAEINGEVGGVSGSQHLYGRAADITCEGLNSLQLHTIILKLIEENKIKEGGVGLYNDFVHYDIRGSKSRWNSSTKYKNNNNDRYAYDDSNED